MKFNELNLVPELINGLNRQNLVETTSIQSEAIPVLLEHHDLIASAKTGTGKTLAYVLPILQQLFLRDECIKYPRTIQTLILVPTRELAIQINEVITHFREDVNLKSTAIFGGVRQGSQVLAIERGIDILVATPGRLLDLYKQQLLDLSHCQTFVLDEADQMLDMGFIKDVEKILPLIKNRQQTLLFSATMPKEVVKLSKKMLKNPIRIQIKSKQVTVETVKQSLYYVDKLNKAKLLLKLLEDNSIYNAIVFVRTKKNAETLAKKLNKHQIPTEFIHGSKSQNARVRALENFKKDKARILVATDLAARGIDVDVLTHVINFDLPETPETYLHRIGRTARKQNDGEAISFCCYQEIPELKAIEKQIKQKIPVKDNPWYPMEDYSNTPIKGTPNLKKKAGKNHARKPNRTNKKK